MFLYDAGNYMVVCKVGPSNDLYGKGFPVYTFYERGDITKMNNDEFITRRLAKPYCEYQINELRDLIEVGWGW